MSAQLIQAPDSKVWHIGLRLPSGVHLSSGRRWPGFLWKPACNPASAALWRLRNGILIDHNWWPVCGQWSGTSWFPTRVQGSAGRRKLGCCTDCLKAVDTIAGLAEESR